MGKIMLNGTQYGVGGIEQAKDISYDNTESGATATDVQGALDELNAGFITDTINCPAISYNSGTVGAYAIEYTVNISKDGYIPVSAVLCDWGHAATYACTLLLVASNLRFILHRASTASANFSAGDVKALVLYKKS